MTLKIFQDASKCRLLNIRIFFVIFSCFEIQAALYQIYPPTPRVETLMRCRIAHTHTILCQCPDSIPACPRCTNWSSCSWQLGPWPSLCRQSAACCCAAVLHSGYTGSRSSAWKSSIRRFVITEKAPTRAPTRAFSWLKAATTAFTFKTLLIHYAKRALTPR